MSIPLATPSRLPDPLTGCAFTPFEKDLLRRISELEIAMTQLKIADQATKARLDKLEGKAWREEA